MKHIKFISASILFVSTSFGAYATPVRWDVNGHWYDINPTRLTWQDAKTSAEAMTFSGYSGHLVTITSAQENDWLFATFGLQLSNPFHWIGAFQPNAMLLDEGWTWVTGEPWSYENWAPNEPNDYFATDPNVRMFEDVVHFFPNGGTMWADTISSVQFPSVVEFEPASVGEPVTILLLGSALAALCASLRFRLRPHNHS